MRLFSGLDAIAVRGPGDEIHALAARRAKRPVAVSGNPFDIGAALRAGNAAGCNRLYGLHGVIPGILEKPRQLSFQARCVMRLYPCTAAPSKCLKITKREIEIDR